MGPLTCVCLAQFFTVLQMKYPITYLCADVAPADHGALLRQPADFTDRWAKARVRGWGWLGPAMTVWLQLRSRAAITRRGVGPCSLTAPSAQIPMSNLPVPRPLDATVTSSSKFPPASLRPLDLSLIHI